MLIARWRRVLFYGALGCGVAILVDGAIAPHVEFTTDRPNLVAVAVAYLMPILMAIAGPPVARRDSRIIGTIALWIGAAVSTTVAANYLFWASGGLLGFGRTGPSLVSTGHYTLAVYQFNEGGGFVNQVCRLAPNLVFERQVYERDPGANVVVRVIDRDHVQVDVGTLTLRPLVWPFC